MALSVAGHLLHFREKAENVLYTRFAVFKYVLLIFLGTNDSVEAVARGFRCDGCDDTTLAFSTTTKRLPVPASRDRNGPLPHFRGKTEIDLYTRFTNVNTVG